MSYVKKFYLDENGEVDLFHDYNDVEEALQQEVASWFKVDEEEEALDE